MTPEALYRSLLRLLPEAFRREAETELLEVFRAAHRQAQARGRAAVTALWVRLFVDIVMTATSERGGLGRRRSQHSPWRQPGSLGSLAVADIRTSLRRVRSNPANACLAAGTLALGLWAALTAMVLVRDILVRPLPFPAPEELVRLREISSEGFRYWPSFPNCADWEAQPGAFETIGCASVPSRTVVTIDGRAVLTQVSMGTDGLFRALRVVPVLGRPFRADDHAPGSAPVALVSHRFWTQTLGGQPLDRLTLAVDSRRLPVVGVLPANFRFLGDGGTWGDPDLWLPMEPRGDLGPRQSHGYHTVGRLRSGVALDSARVEMTALVARINGSHNEPTHAEDIELTPLTEVVVRTAREPLRLLSGAAAALLLVACLNFGATLLARGLSRLRELSVRLTLGATTMDVVRLLVIEALVLAVPAALVGVLATAATLRALVVRFPDVLPRLTEVAADANLALAGIGLAIVSAVIAACVPAMMLSSRTLTSRLTSRSSVGGTRHRGVWSAALTLQVAAAVVLVLGSGVLLRSVSAAMSVPLGYDSASTTAVTVVLPEGLYPAPQDRRRFVVEALRRLSDQSSSEAVTLTNVLPHVTQAVLAGTRAGDDEVASSMAGHRVVTPDFFSTLRIPVPQSTGPLQPGAVFVDETLVSRLWPDGIPIGASIRSGFHPDPLPVAGVVASVREWQQEEGSPGAVYYDYRTEIFDLDEVHFLVRYRGDRTAAERDMRTSLEGLDARLPVALSSLDSAASESLGARRAVLVVVALFSLAALGIAATGVYAIVSFVAGQRLHEAAIRKALGAKPLQIVGTMVAIGVLPTLAGVLLGWLAWIPASAAIEQLLFRTPAFDPAVMVVSGAALALASLVAGLWPARRAARVEPLALLRDG